MHTGEGRAKRTMKKGAETWIIPCLESTPNSGLLEIKSFHTVFDLGFCY